MQALKPAPLKERSFFHLYVRAEARTLQRAKFLHRLFTSLLTQWVTPTLGLRWVKYFKMRPG
jgi:hypothetical protein